MRAAFQSHSHPQHGMTEVDGDGLACARRLSARRHVMDRKGAPLAIGRVGRGAVQGLTVVEGDASGRKVAHDSLVVVNHFAHVEKDIAALGLVVDHGTKVRPGDELHRAIVQVDVIQCEPAADQVRR